MFIREKDTTSLRRSLADPSLSARFQLAMERASFTTSPEEGKEQVRQWLFKQEQFNPTFPAARLWSYLQQVLLHTASQPEMQEPPNQIEQNKQARQRDQLQPEKKRTPPSEIQAFKRRILPHQKKSLRKRRDSFGTLTISAPKDIRVVTGLPLPSTQEKKPATGLPLPSTQRKKATSPLFQPSKTSSNPEQAQSDQKEEHRETSKSAKAAPKRRKKARKKAKVKTLIADTAERARIRKLRDRSGSPQPPKTKVKTLVVETTEPPFAVQKSEAAKAAARRPILPQGRATFHEAKPESPQSETPIQSSPTPADDVHKQSVQGQEQSVLEAGTRSPKRSSTTSVEGAQKTISTKEEIDAKIDNLIQMFPPNEIQSRVEKEQDSVLRRIRLQVEQTKPIYFLGLVIILALGLYFGLGLNLATTNRPQGKPVPVQIYQNYAPIIQAFSHQKTISLVVTSHWHDNITPKQLKRRILRMKSLLQEQHFTKLKVFLENGKVVFSYSLRMKSEMR